MAGFHAGADAASGSEALQNAEQKRPDLVLMAVYMPQMDGFEATRRLTTAHLRAATLGALWATHAGDRRSAGSAG